MDLNNECIQMIGSGWLSAIIRQTEDLLWGRWSYWLKAWSILKVPDDPIPQINFEDQPHPFVLKMLQACIDEGFRGSVDVYRGFEYFLDWLLWSLGITPDEPTLPNAEIRSDRVFYQMFRADAMLLYPYDYLGHYLAELGHGKLGSSFYPTPMSLTQLMGQLLKTEDSHKTQSICDPAVGTGRTLLEASNHSLRLYGQDLDPLVLKITKIQMYLYAPWGIYPLPDDVYQKKQSSTTGEHHG